MFAISRESLFYAYLRQAYLLSPYMISRISSKTVLFTDVPDEYQNETQLRRILRDVRYVWLVSKSKELEELIEDRDDAVNKLETGEVKLIKQYLKQHKKGKASRDESSANAQHQRARVDEIDSKKRPTHRTKPIIGSKVDTILWSRNQLRSLRPKISKEQHRLRGTDAEHVRAAFVEFETVAAAQAAYQQIAHQTPFRITAKDIGMEPSMVLWKNLRKPWWLVKVLAGVSTAIITLACLFWTIPVAFIGVLTNVNYLTNKLTWLSFIDSIPDPIMGVVTGLLPVLLLTLLMKLVPIFCNMLAKQFEPTLGMVQLRTQSWYFAFEVIQVFLITTFTSGAASVATQIIEAPTQAPLLLARNLPKASNFYISYFILFGLATAAMQLLNIMPLLFIAILGKVLDKTPRKMYNRYVSLSGIGWGTFYPKFLNLGVIGKHGST
jgi:calcium permeable stress-gated cation channel